MKTIDSILDVYSMSFEITKIINKIKRLVYHVNRCKNPFDQMKLILLITTNTVYCAVLVAKVSEINNELFGLSTKKPQLLLNEFN